MTALEKLECLLFEYDTDLRFEVASGGRMWSGRLRMTLTKPDQKPSRSLTFYTVGAWGPEDAAAKLLADFEEWRSRLHATVAYVEWSPND